MNPYAPPLPPQNKKEKKNEKLVELATVLFRNIRIYQFISHSGYLPSFFKLSNP